MTQQVLIGSSACGCDEDARRLKACSHISVMAYFSEPSWQVVLDPFERRVAVTFGDRSYGDADLGHDDVMDLYFRTPSTVYALGVALIEASRQLEPIVAAHQDSAPPESEQDVPDPDAAGGAEPVPVEPAAVPGGSDGRDA